MTPRLPLTDFQATLPEALPRHLRRRITLGPEGCWLVAHPSSHRYASVSIENKTRLAHRVAYQLLVGPIPKGHEVDHQCHTRDCALGDACPHRYCANPAHLKAMTGRENNLRSGSASAINADRAICENGHTLAGKNVYIRPDGRGRQCRPCADKHAKTYRDKKVAARAQE